MYSSRLLFNEFNVFDLTDLYIYKVIYFMNKIYMSWKNDRICTNTRKNGQAATIPVHKCIYV